MGFAIEHPTHTFLGGCVVWYWAFRTSGQHFLHALPGRRCAPVIKSAPGLHLPGRVRSCVGKRGDKYPPTQRMLHRRHQKQPFLHLAPSECVCAGGQIIRLSSDAWCMGWWVKNRRGMPNIWIAPSIVGFKTNEPEKRPKLPWMGAPPLEWRCSARLQHFNVCGCALNAGTRAAVCAENMSAAVHYFILLN